jgi:hypothetical protein
MILLNVAFFACSGMVGLSFLRKALDAVFAHETGTPASQAAASQVFRAWTLIYAIVGAQMGWILRPFIGAPNAPFQWFRARDSNFFVAVWESLLRLF